MTGGAVVPARGSGARLRSALVLANAFSLIGLAYFFLLWPAGHALLVIRSGVLADPAVPAFAFRWHAKLSQELGPWAERRVASGRATTLSKNDIAGTEWPVFSAVFYLWATQALETQAVQDGRPAPRRPSRYARRAIDAAAALIADPGHAAWVRQHWGDAYLERENLFYRMLLISGLASYQDLTGEQRYASLLQRQTNLLADELDASPHGLLDDYPEQCYPIDIVAAIAAIQRADAVLNTDHRAMVARALRGFEGDRLDPRTGLPAYVCDARSGIGVGPARGVGVAFMTLWAGELWPQTAANWFDRFEQHYWSSGRWLSGYREFPRHIRHANLLVDVDAGPVVFGYGTTASAFGIGAARSMGRHDRAGTLGALAFAAMWPTPDGRLLAPRLISSITDAPFTGEAILLFSFTRPALVEASVVGEPAPFPGAAVVVVVGGLLAGLAITVAAVRRAHRHWRVGDRLTSAGHLGPDYGATLRGLLGLALILGGWGLVLGGSVRLGVLCVCAAQLLARGGVPRRHEGAA